MSDLRMLVREILAAELETIKRDGFVPWKREEAVSISTDAELAAFVKRLMRMIRDGGLKADIESGRHVFTLARPGAGPARPYQPLAPHPTPAATVALQGGIITEKEIQNLPENLKILSVDRTARFTPLANDEIRRRNIRVERART
ncbi:MAG: hypothetical protein OXU98_04645 [Gammaproteobacteria bacterium]|nr:hypothetical protein [Gammaproteobacteria bacterium]